MTIVEDIIYPASLLAGWSLIYRDNPFWRFWENAIVGLGTAITLKNALDTIFNQQLSPIMRGELYPALVGIVLGILVLTRLFRGSIREYSYIPFAIMTGVGTAIGAQGAVGAQILKQTVFKPFIGGSAWTNISNFLLFFCTLTTMCYFVFTIKRGGISGPLFGAIGFLGGIGRYVMMAAFGVTLSVFYIGTGTSMVVYSEYLLSPIGRWVTVAGIAILGFGVYRSLTKQEETTTAEDD
jgi:hypothetical protein